MAVEEAACSLQRSSLQPEYGRSLRQIFGKLHVRTLFGQKELQQAHCDPSAYVLQAMSQSRMHCALHSNHTWESCSLPFVALHLSRIPTIPAWPLIRSILDVIAQLRCCHRFALRIHGQFFWWLMYLKARSLQQPHIVQQTALVWKLWQDSYFL